MVKAMLLAVLLLPAILSGQAALTPTPMTGVASSPGTPLIGAVLESNAWGLIIWTDGEYIIGMNSGRTVLARFSVSGTETVALYIGEVTVEFPQAAVSPPPETVTTWTSRWQCSCSSHYGRWQEVTTRITGEWTREDVRKHDRKVAEIEKEHPQIPQPRTRPPAEGGTTTPPPDQLILISDECGGDGGLVNLPGGGSWSCRRR